MKTATLTNFITQQPNTSVAVNDKIMLGGESLSSRLRYAMGAVKISQSELARRIQVKPQVIQYLCNSAVVKSKFTYDIAAALDVNYAWLAEGKGSAFVQQDAEEPSVSPFKVPIINWEQSLDWSNQSMQFHPSVHKSWTVTNLDTSDTCFALQIKDSSMQPRFDLGSTLIVDPTESPYDGSYVIVYIDSLKETLLRQLTIDDSGQKTLSPANQKLYKNIEFDESEDNILGVVVQAHFQFLDNRC